MPTILIVGASRGIGLGLVEAYAAAGWRVHATSRTPGQPGRLADLPGEVVIHGLEARDIGQIDALATAVEREAIDLLVHNAGVGDRGRSREEVMQINAVAPIRVVEALLDAVARSAQRKVVLMTSQLGARRGRSESLGDYGDSKAALNDAFRDRADAWAKRAVTAIVMHPGWVRTDMGGAAAPLSIRESVDSMRRVIAELRPEDHGRFLTWDGREHPW